jgi:hypothetical protein
VKHFPEVLDELSRLNVEFLSFRENQKVTADQGFSD